MLKPFLARVFARVARLLGIPEIQHRLDHAARQERQSARPCHHQPQARAGAAGNTSNNLKNNLEPPIDADARR